MGIVVRQSSISTALTFIGAGLGYLNVLYFFPLYLSPEQIGLTRVIQDFAMLLVPFAQFGISQATLKYFPSFAKNEEKKHGFLTLMLSLALAGFILFVLVFIIFRDPVSGIFSQRSPEVNRYLGLIIVLTFILVVYNILTDYSRSLLKIVAPNFLREVLLRLLITISIFLYFFNIVGFEGFIFCVVAAYFVNLVILTIYLALNGALKISFNLKGIVKEDELKSIVKYALFALIGASGAVIIAKVDSVMVTSMLGTYFNGIYTTAFYMAVIIEVPKRMIAQISTPLIARDLENQNDAGVDNLYKKTALNQLIVGTLLFIGLWSNLESIYNFIPSNEIYIQGKWVVVVIALAKLIDMGSGLNGEIIILSRFYKSNILFTIVLAVFMVIFNLFLIPRYGITGAAYGTAISMFFFNLTKYLFLLRKLNFQPFTLNNLKVIIIGTSILFLGLNVPKLDNIIGDILIRSISITIIYSGLIIIFKCSDDVTAIFNKSLEFIRRRR